MPTLHYPIRVPSDVLEALGEFTGNFWSDTLALEPFISDAIRSYIQPALAGAAQQAAGSGGAGYQWKQVFLPDGTRLRASFGGHSYLARVEGDEIRCDGHVVSPSRFANLQGSGNRNAWKAVWLCLPGSEEWLLADDCRSARQAAVARLIGESAPAAQAQPQPPVPQQRRLRERRNADRRSAFRMQHCQHSQQSSVPSAAASFTSQPQPAPYPRAEPADTRRAGNRSGRVLWAKADGWRDTAR